jgi:hypothetical protein
MVDPNQYRQIDVTVSRRDSIAQYRHGYQAKPLADNPDDYRRTVTDAQLEEGLFRLLHPIPKIPDYSGQAPPTLSLEVSKDAGSAASRTLQVTVSVDARYLYFREQGLRYATELDLRLVADDAQRNMVGQRIQRLPLVLTADELERLRRRVRPQSLTFDVTMEVKTRPAFLRGVLYQFETNRVVSGQLRLPK